jgi:uncharacterized protein YraI
MSRLAAGAFLITLLLSACGLAPVSSAAVRPTADERTLSSPTPSVETTASVEATGGQPAGVTPVSATAPAPDTEAAVASATEPPAPESLATDTPALIAPETPTQTPEPASALPPTLTGVVGPPEAPKSLKILDAANIRSGPGLGYPVIGGLQRDSLAEVIGRDSTSQWYAIRFGDGQGWVSSTVAAYPGGAAALPEVATPASTATRTPLPPTPAPAAQLRILADANVRSGPGLDYPVVGGLLADTLADVVGRDKASEWYVIRYGGGQGWVSSTVAAYPGDAAALPVIAAPSKTPTSTATSTPPPATATRTPTATQTLTRTATPFVFTCASVTELSAPECAGLIAFYRSTSGAAWTNSTGWLANHTPCSWYGITCSGGYVTGIPLIGNGLSGKLPAEIGRFSRLEQLILYDNPLTGGIPKEIGSLVQLRLLYLSHTLVSGEIPDELGELVQLQELGLSSTALSGAFPPWISSLSQLRVLSLSNTSLSGSLPAGIGSLPLLQELYLGNTSVSGGIPVEIGYLRNLRYLYVNGTLLSGPLPDSLTNIPALKSLDYSDTSLCTPRSAGFVSWLGRITLVHQSGLSCP